MVFTKTGDLLGGFYTASAQTSPSPKSKNHSEEWFL